jgi:transcriptional regulator with XRE-family HTH domain
MTSTEFKQARISCGLTQSEIAVLMGMPQSAVARIESGARNPTRQHAATVALITIMSVKGLFL